MPLKPSRYIIPFLLLLLVNTYSFAQYKQGIKLYEQNNYIKAIPKLKKASTKNGENKQDAMIKLADSYRLLKDYSNAEAAYKRAIELNSNVPALVHYHYGQMLKANNHYDEALKQFYLYLEDNPTDQRAAHAIKSCNEIKIWQNKPKEYEVSNLKEVNSKHAEFSPVLFENKLVFVSERNPDLVNYQEYEYNGQPYLNVYFSKMKDDVPSKKIKGFSKKLNTNYHDGPICFSSDEKNLYLTRVNYIVNLKNKNFVNRAKLFYAHRDGKVWAKLQSFPYNSDEYSIAHPSISNDGNTLFFASDMPGGMGGMDIYSCKKNGDSWDKPVNLGPDINTSGDEVFPFIAKNNILYYSSDGLPGFGALDIFSARELLGKWILQRNEGLGINSFHDDFGVYFADDKKGYFSSDRDGGSGNDDIYRFSFTSRYTSLDGYVLNSNNPNDVAPNQKVLLKENDGTLVASTKTNEKGYFRFDNLETDKKYLVKIDETDPGYNGNRKFYYADNKNNVLRVTVLNEKGEKFIFRNLPADPNAPAELSSPDDLMIAGNLLFGENPSKPISDSKIILKDSKGNIVEEVTTNGLGGFVFTKLSSDENFMIEVLQSDLDLSNAKIILTNKSGKQIKVINAGSNGKFAFHILNTEKVALEELKVEDKDLLMNLRGKLLDPSKNNLAGKTVMVMDDKGNIVASVVTDEKGNFEFKNLAAGKSYLIGIEEKDGNLAGFEKLFIADANGKIIREIFRDRIRGFKFHLLETEKSALAELFVDDPWLEVLNFKNAPQAKKELTIVEKVSYGLNEHKFDKAGQMVLDKVIQIMKDNPGINIELGSHTDSRADDQFNQKLSQKRAKFAVDYIISKGIDKSRLIPVGHGESKLLNNCGNGVNCAEEMHAVNRRTEFRVIDTGTK